LAYPGVVVPLFIGRPRSIRAIDQAMMSDTPLVLAFQKDPQREDADEVHGWGCLAWAYQVLKLPDQSMKALIGAVGRARIDDFRLTAELAEVRAETVVDIAEDAIDPRIMHEAMQRLERRARERNDRSEDELLDMLDDCSDNAAELERNLLRYANPDTGSVVELLSSSHRSQRLMRLSAARRLQDGRRHWRSPGQNHSCAGASL
jgi:ATP-dependent Lon protease